MPEEISSAESQTQKEPISLIKEIMLRLYLKKAITQGLAIGGGGHQSYSVQDLAPKDVDQEQYDKLKDSDDFEQVVSPNPSSVQEGQERAVRAQKYLDVQTHQIEQKLAIFPPDVAKLLVDRTNLDHQELDFVYSPDGSEADYDPASGKGKIVEVVQNFGVNWKVDDNGNIIPLDRNVNGENILGEIPHYLVQIAQNCDATETNAGWAVKRDANQGVISINRTSPGSQERSDPCPEYFKKESPGSPSS